MEKHRDRGAAAVEFGLVLPLLLALTIGIIAFGHAFHIQTVLDNAAREGVRIFALEDDGDPGAQARARAIEVAAPSIALTNGQIAIGPAGCPPGQNAVVTITLTDFQLLGGFWNATLTGTGSMRCNG
ncbi:MAG: TadE/TadG family type IV pilus assembly protein [Actinomycetota bacterium]